MPEQNENRRRESGLIVDRAFSQPISRENSTTAAESARLRKFSLNLFAKHQIAFDRPILPFRISACHCRAHYVAQMVLALSLVRNMTSILWLYEISEDSSCDRFEQGPWLDAPFNIVDAQNNDMESLCASFIGRRKWLSVVRRLMRTAANRKLLHMTSVRAVHANHRHASSILGRFAWSVRLDRPSNREECSLRFETPDNTGNEQRGVLGSALLEEEYVLRCLSARAITEAA